MINKYSGAKIGVLFDSTKFLGNNIEVDPNIYKNEQPK